MKVFWVYGWYVYDPSVDNFVASFETYEEAEEFVRTERDRSDAFDRYCIKDIAERLGLL